MSAYSQDLCLVGISGGVSTIGLSVSGGSYMIDENCERIKLSKTLSDLGMKVAAVSIFVKMKECSLQWNNQAHHVRLKVKLVRRFRPVEKI